MPAEPRPLIRALEQTADEYRYHYRLAATPSEWYVRFPYWVVAQGNKTIEQFAAEFEESVTRMAGLPLGDLVGFETDAPGGGVYRYRLSWLTPEAPAVDERIPE